MLRDIYNERGLRNQFEMNTVVIEDSGWMEWLSRDIGLGQFAPKPSRLDQLRRRDMIRVSIRPVRCKNPARLYFTKKY